MKNNGKAMEKNFGLVGKRCIGAATKGHLNEIENNIDDRVISKIVGYDKEAKDAWYRVFDVLSLVENETKMPFHFSDKVNVFALDPLIIADLIGISKKDRSEALQIYIIYYLMVHVLDDLGEDYEKFCSNFSVIDEDESRKDSGDMKVAGASFVYLALIAVNKILEKGKYEPAAINEIMQRFLRSISIQIKYFTFQSKDIMSAEKVFDIKQHHVSGEATAFIVDCLQIDLRYDQKTYKHLRKALYYLGSLTQFTDDLRDYADDVEKNNANLFVSMKNEYGDGAVGMYVDWYVKEEKLMSEEIQKSKLNLDYGLVSCIPWYPYFYNKYLPKDER